jgi:hypothetical protein
VYPVGAATKTMWSSATSSSERSEANSSNDAISVVQALNNCSRTVESSAGGTHARALYLVAIVDLDNVDRKTGLLRRTLAHADRAATLAASRSQDCDFHGYALVHVPGNAMHLPRRCVPQNDGRVERRFSSTVSSTVRRFALALLRCLKPCHRRVRPD